MEFRTVNRSGTALASVVIAAVIGLGGCVRVDNHIRADRDWYTLKEATNGRNMVLGSWQLCQHETSCSPQEQSQLQRERERAQAEYQKALSAVQYDHAHGWYANVNAMPAFARDPSLGLSP
jgi:uncharacterized protein HemX